MFPFDTEFLLEALLYVDLIYEPQSAPHEQSPKRPNMSS
jgi:hypothetical protein